MKKRLINQSSERELRSGITTPKLSSPSSLFTILAFLVVLLHIYASFFPSALNWGFHYLFYFDTPLKIIWLLLALSVVIPATRERLARLAERLSEKLSGLPRIPLIGVATICLGILLWIGRSQWHLLGDGLLVIRNLKIALAPQLIIPQFGKEPLSVYINWNLYQSLKSSVETEPEVIFGIIGLAFGIIFLWLAAWFVKSLKVDHFERNLIATLLLAAGTVLLLFGYVENYTVFYTITLAYLITSYFYFDRRRYFFPATILYGIMFALHFSAIFLLPSYVYLLLQKTKRSLVGALLAGALTPIVAAIVLTFINYPLREVPKAFFGEESHLIPFFGMSSPRHNYIFTSWQHGLDLFNAVMLTSPAVLLLMPILVGAIFSKKINWREPTAVFAILVSVCGFGFVSLANPDLGMSRDWDVFTIYCFPSIFLVIVLFIQHPKLEKRKELLFASAVLTLLHTIPWIVLNANEEKSLERHKILVDERLYGKHARANFYEELAVYYRENKNYQAAIDAFGQFLLADSANPRIYNSIGHVYDLMGDRDKAIASLETAVRKGSRDARVFVSLGALLSDKKDFDRAIELTKKAIELDPRSVGGYLNLGVYYYEGRADCQEAYKYFLQTVSLDPRSSEAKKGAALTALCLGKREEADLYLRDYAQLNPEDPDIMEIKSEIDRILRKTK